MEFTFEKIASNMYLFTFDTRYNLCMTFVRLIEFNVVPESRFCNQYFTLEEFMDWYSLERSDKSSEQYFTYPIDNSGFNVYGKDFLLWYRYFKNNLGKKEKMAFKNILKLDRKEIQKSYFIAIYKGRGMRSTLNHEKAHTYYAENKDYRRKVHKLIRQLTKEEKAVLIKKLKKEEYLNEVINEEMNAYIATGGHRNIPTGHISNRKEFIKLFKEMNNAENKKSAQA